MDSKNLNNKGITVKYFDEEMKLRILPLSQAFGIVNGVKERNDGSYFLLPNYYQLIGIRNDQLLFRKALKQMKEGDTLEYFLDLCSSVHFDINIEPMAWIDRFISQIEQPNIERETGNFNKKTFDFIRIRVHLNDLNVNTKQAVREHYYEILDRALTKITKNRSFQNYNVPINALKATKVTLTQQKVLEILFELKELSHKEENHVI